MDSGSDQIEHSIAPSPAFIISGGPVGPEPSSSRAQQSPAKPNRARPETVSGTTHHPPALTGRRPKRAAVHPEAGGGSGSGWGRPGLGCTSTPPTTPKPLYVLHLHSFTPACALASSDPQPKVLIVGSCHSYSRSILPRHQPPYSVTPCIL